MTPVMSQAQPPTRDAWVLLCLATALYIGASLVLQRFSIIGGVIAAQMICLFLPSLAYAKWKTAGIKEALRLRPVPAEIFLRVVLLAITGMGLATLVDQATRPLALDFFPDWIPALEALMQIVTPRTPQDLLQNLCVIGIAAPICEEVLFRGAFQGTLEKRGPVRAIAVSALMFGLIRLNPFNFVGPILFGVGFGLVARQHGLFWLFQTRQRLPLAGLSCWRFCDLQAQSRISTERSAANRCRHLSRQQRWIAIQPQPEVGGEQLKMLGSVATHSEVLTQ